MRYHFLIFTMRRARREEANMPRAVKKIVCRTERTV